MLFINLVFKKGQTLLESLPLIIICFLIVLALIILPLIVSYKAEKKDYDNKTEWEKIKEYGNKVNDKARKRH